jgi:hypothetical protein
MAERRRASRGAVATADSSAPVGPHAAQQQLLAFLGGPPEFQPERDGNPHIDEQPGTLSSPRATVAGGCVAVFQLSAVQR